MDSGTPITCHECGATYSAIDLVQEEARWWPALDVILTSTPCCGAREEIRIEPGVVWRGYVYAAASPHFAAMERHECPGLTEVRAGEGQLRVMAAGGEIVMKELQARRS